MRVRGAMLAAGLALQPCAGGQAAAQETPTLEQARAFLHQHTDMQCDKRNNPRLNGQDRVHPLSAAARNVTLLYDLYCDNAGAQTTRVFMVWSSFQNRFRLLHFARPVYTLRYKDEAVRVALAEPVRVLGFDVFTAMPAATFDPDRKTLASDIPWGSSGDSGEYGRWAWNHATERFDLIAYTLDPYHESDLEPVHRKDWVGRVIRLFPFNT